MLGSMQNQEQVLRGEAAHWRLQQGDCLETRPQGRRIKREKEGGGGQRPMQFDEHVRSGLMEFVHLERMWEECRCGH